MEKISYLKGLLEGLGVHPESREGKIFYAICAALDESADYINKLENRVAELEELCDVLDEDLAQLEEEFDAEEYNTCASCPSSETRLSRHYDDNAENAVPVKSDPPVEEDTEDTGELYQDEDEEYETVCPTCGKVILLTEQMLEDGETICPNCGEELEFDFDEEEMQKLAPADDHSDE